MNSNQIKYSNNLFKKKSLRLIKNFNAIQLISPKKSIGIDLNNKRSFDTNEQSSNLTSIEQKQLQYYVGNLMNTESNHNNRKSIVKTSYQIPSPTILLPNEFSSSPKPITNNNLIINKLQRSTPIDNHRNIFVFNQPNSFHLKNHSIDNTEESILNSDHISSTNQDNLNRIQTLPSSQFLLSSTNITSQQFQISHYEDMLSHKTDQNNISLSQHNILGNQSPLILPRFIDKPILSLSQLINNIDNDVHSSPISILSQGMESSPLKLFRDKIDNENIHFELATDTSSYETSPQIKIRHEIKHIYFKIIFLYFLFYEPESLWKTKLTLKTLLSIANRDEAQALKDRKPIDYHMFLNNKLNKNSIFQYNDNIDMKFTSNNKRTTIEQLNQQDYKENRKLYKRLLNTMGLRKPINIKKSESMISIKQTKPKCTTKTIPFNIFQENITSSFDNSSQYLKNNENEKPILINYQAVPISVFNK